MLTRVQEFFELDDDDAPRWSCWLAFTTSQTHGKTWSLELHRVNLP